MVRHAVSHGLSVLLCTVTAAVLIEVIRPVVPGVIKVGENLSRFVFDKLSLNVSYSLFNIVFVATFLGLLWGVFFRMRYRKEYPAKRCRK
jgi:hypothetical protein